MAENTLLLDTHSSTTEKSNLEIRGDDSFTHIKEEPVNHEFIEFQEPSRKNSVTENTAQLDTDSSTAEKSNMVFRGHNFINHFKEEPVSSCAVFSVTLYFVFETMSLDVVESTLKYHPGMFEVLT